VAQTDLYVAAWDDSTTAGFLKRSAAGVWSVAYTAAHTGNRIIGLQRSPVNPSLFWAFQVGSATTNQPGDIFNL